MKIDLTKSDMKQVPTKAGNTLYIYEDIFASADLGRCLASVFSNKALSQEQMKAVEVELTSFNRREKKATFSVV